MLPMMTYRDEHLVRTSLEYEAAQVAFVVKRRARGANVRIHDGTEPVIAYVNHGRWVVLCACGAGNVIDFGATRPLARCFGCGAIHTEVEMPPAGRLAVEAILLQRPRLVTRNWLPGETLDDLQAENRRELR